MNNILNKFTKFVERVDDNSWEDEWNNDDIGSFNSKFDDDYTDYYDKEYYGYQEDLDDEDDDMENIKHLLRQMFKNKGLDVFHINNKKFDLEISIIVGKKEKLSDIINIFDLLNKLNKDILPQYDSEFDMWTNRRNEQVFEIKFLYNDEYYEDDEWSNEDDDDDKYNKNFRNLPF